VGRWAPTRRASSWPSSTAPAFSTPVGSLTPPIETFQGIFLLTVFGLTNEPPQPYEAMKEALTQQVYADRIEDETDQWYRQARRRAAVLVKLETPE
jgi:hypothetical protein